MADSFFFLNKIDHLRDPIRNTRWRVIIPSAIFAAIKVPVTNGKQFSTDDASAEDFTLHVKTCDFPDVTTQIDKQWYMGFGSAFPVGTKIDNDFSFETLLLEDMRAYEAMLAWNQACLNVGILAGSAGSDGIASNKNDVNVAIGSGVHKDRTSTDAEGSTLILRNSMIRVELYNWYSQAVIATLRMLNAFPTTVAGPKGFAYTETATLQKFNFTLHCDRWTLFTVPETA